MRAALCITTAALALCLASCGDSGPHSYVVRFKTVGMNSQPVPDTINHAAEGTCMVDNGTAMTSQPLLLLASETATFKGYSISCTAQLKNEYDTTEMTITRDGQILGTSASTTRFGVVTVAGR